MFCAILFLSKVPLVFKGRYELRLEEGFLARVEPLPVGLYARISTHDQQTLPLQVNAMRQYTRRRSWKVVKSVEDVGSGAAERPQRQELIKAARHREIDVILVWRLDRWGRSLLDQIGSLEELSTLGVGFVSLCEALDLTTPSGSTCRYVSRFRRV
jgi:DNA invertase Pin-like site-specific DNA recombinase